VTITERLRRVQWYVCSGREAIVRQFQIDAITLDDDVGDHCVSGGVDSCDQHIDQRISGFGERAPAAAASGAVVAESSLPQHQHTVDDIGRRMSAG